MQKIDISITKAKIISYNVELTDQLPNVSATIGLYTETDKKISTFTVSTHSWQDVAFDLPAQMVIPIVEIAHKLEEITMRACSSAIGYIEAPKQ